MIDPNCWECEGTGLVAPSPFFGERVPWLVWLLGALNARLRVGGGAEGCATAMGLIRPVVCPLCNADGTPDGNPWDLREIASVWPKPMGGTLISTRKVVGNE